MEEGPCSCASKWLIQSIHRANASLCTVCGTHLPEECLAQTLLCSCPKTPGMVHAYGIYIHAECYDGITQKHRGRLYDVVSGTPMDIDETKFKEKANRCLRRHQLTGRSCGFCNSHEQRTVKFPHCSICKTTVYCDRECQKADWATHSKTH
jgi:MYND finger